MKHIIELLILLAIVASVAALTSCNEGQDARENDSESPPPHEVLKEQVRQERELREQSEARADEAASEVSFWEGATVVIFIMACIAFIFGTAIGSRGRKRAGS